MTSEFQRRFTQALTPPPIAAGDDVLRWKSFTSAPFEYFIRFFGDRACKVHCTENTYDPAIVLAFLHDLSAVNLDAVKKDDFIALFPSHTLQQTAFELGVLAAPSLINGSVAEETDRMGSAVYTAFPAYRCEFPVHDPGYEIDFRLHKVIPWSEWTRPPAPALRAKYSLNNGSCSADPEYLYIFSLTEIERIMTRACRVGGVVDVENFEGARERFQFLEDHCLIGPPDTPHVIANAAALDVLRTFAIEGAVGRHS